MYKKCQPLKHDIFLFKKQALESGGNKGLSPFSFLKLMIICTFITMVTGLNILFGYIHKF